MRTSPTRREFLLSAAASFALANRLRAQPRGSMRIGIIGAGRIGGAVGIEWAKAGHEVFFSSRNPE
jgi:hypothetical protein